MGYWWKQSLIKTNTIIESLFDRLVGRYSKQEIMVDPKTEKSFWKVMNLLPMHLHRRLWDAGVEGMYIRSAFTCKPSMVYVRVVTGRKIHARPARMLKSEKLPESWLPVYRRFSGYAPDHAYLPYRWCGKVPTVVISHRVFPVSRSCLRLVVRKGVAVLHRSQVEITDVH